MIISSDFVSCDVIRLSDDAFAHNWPAGQMH